MPRLFYLPLLLSTAFLWSSRVVGQTSATGQAIATGPTIATMGRMSTASGQANAFVGQTGIAARKPIAPMQGSPRSAVLDSYIRTGLDSNLALHQRNFDMEKARLDLKRAQSLFYPQAGFSSQYTIANGGRSQSIPVGDLLNNVYSTLNKLTGTSKFPQVGNQSISFLPNDFHDTKVEVTLPVINPDLQHNKQVSSEMINTRNADIDIYKRELVQQIRQAYYRYLQAGKAAAVYENSLNLARENKRVSMKFVENRMATKEIVLRAQAQVSQAESALIEARNDIRNASAWFNFLLNRPLDASIQSDPSLFEGSISDMPSPKILPGTDMVSLPEGREELTRLRSMRSIMESNLRWSRSYLLPRLNAFYDIGFQGFGFHFDNTQFYQMAGLQLQWQLFKAGDNKYKVSQARIDIESVGEQYKELSQQLTLQVQTAANDYNSAVDALQPLSDEVTSARETYRLTEKRFNEGQALQIELIDARSQMTSAEIRYSLGGLKVLDKAADLERVTASYKF